MIKEEKSRRIYEKIEESRIGCTQREITEKTGYSRPTVIKYIEELIKKDIVQKIPKGPSNIYIADKEV